MLTTGMLLGVVSALAEQLSQACAGGECLGLFGPSAWLEASATCKSWGGWLATIRSESKNEAVRAIVGTGTAYIGIHEGAGPCNRKYCWVSQDGSLSGNPDLTYTAWAPGEPLVVACGFINAATGLWGTDGDNCNFDLHRHFVCERPATASATTVTASSSTTTATTTSTTTTTTAAAASTIAVEWNGPYEDRQCGNTGTRSFSSPAPESGFCSGKTDCFMKGMAYCASEPICKGVMYNSGWKKMQVQYCTSSVLVKNRGWTSYTKITTTTTTTTTTATTSFICTDPVRPFKCADGFGCLQTKDVCDGGVPDCADGSDEVNCITPVTSTSGVVAGLAVALAIAVLATVAMYIRPCRPAAGNAGNNDDTTEVFTVVNTAFGRPEGDGYRESVDGKLPRRPMSVRGNHQPSSHRQCSATANVGSIEGYLDVGADTDPGYSNVGLHGASHGGSPGYYNAPGRTDPQQVYEEVDESHPANQEATAAKVYALDGDGVPATILYDEVSPSNGVRLDQDNYVDPAQVVDGSRA